MPNWIYLHKRLPAKLLKLQPFGNLYLGGIAIDALCFVRAMASVPCGLFDLKNNSPNRFD
ncbi:hypothetical protein GCM10009124_08860 [Shewanella xiamenensis]|nr:hypothetical protein GCM10009124_08860 [Shewanella xiamenensis]